MAALNERVALITGASRGIGASVAKGLAREGAHVILLARTQAALEEVDDEIRSFGGKATLIPLDLARLDEVDKLGPSIYERFGRLDIFIGNAAVLGTLGPVNHITPREWEKAFTVNVMANVRLVRSLDPMLRGSDAGRVVFTTSGFGEQAMAYWGPYCATKAALNLFAQTYAGETAKTNLRINLVSPGPVDTAMLRKAFPGGFQGAMKTPDDVVPAYLKLVAANCNTHGEIISL
ncbi:MAG: SDR family NAD(P)-dependent oxidoreductase [Micavibrio sp.]|nr:SDR family NAD(P)-dependent oxidoreductase [Micavibrio sp.]